MGLNTFSSDLDNQEDGGLALGKVSEELSEAYKDQVKKGKAHSQKTRKDEKKAKKQDMLLAKFLVKILVDKRYDSLFPYLFKSFDIGVPSNLILGILSLVYLDISNEIRDNIDKLRINFKYHSEKTINFSDTNLPQEIKDRINSWVEDIVVIILLNSSKIYTKRIIENIKNSPELKDFTSSVFKYFLEGTNIYITDEKSKEYAIFIMNKIILPKIEK